MVASIPFGNGNRQRRGYVIGLSKTPKISSDRIKPLMGLVSGQETTEARLVSLAAWMRERYGSTMAQALKTVIPVQEKVRAKEKREISLNISASQAEELAASLEKKRCRARAELLSPGGM